MEGAKERAVVAVMLIMMLVLQAGEPTAAIEEPELMAACYAGCFVPCVIFNPADQCAMQCLQQCIILPASTSTSLVDRNHYYCHLGCASSMCSKITTAHNIRAATKEVESCVNSCTQSCTKHN